MAVGSTSIFSGGALISEVIPAIGHLSEHHRAKCEAKFAELVRFIAETGDGEFAVVLGKALQFLPEAQAHHENLLDIDSLVRDTVCEEGLVLPVVDLVCHKKVLSLLGSAGLHLTLAEVV